MNVRTLLVDNLPEAIEKAKAELERAGLTVIAQEWDPNFKKMRIVGKNLDAAQRPGLELVD